MIALVDCISFYANVERQFHASLQNRPVVVLSPNDGNIISLSAEAKKIGLKRGMAYHQDGSTGYFSLVYHEQISTAI